MQSGSQSQLWVMGNSSATIGGTNISGTMYSNGMSLSAAAPGGGGNTLTVSAANGTFQSNAITFANSNGVSFSTGTQGVYATVATNYQSPGAYLTTAMASNAVTLSNIRVSAGTTSNLLSAITFSNLNGVSFGLNGSVVTGSHNGLTTARASNDAIGLNTALTGNGVAWTVNSSGLSLNVPAFLTTAMASNAGSNFVGVTTVSGTNVSGTFASNGISLSANAGGGGGGIAVSAGGSNFTSGTVTFGNTNGVSFITTNGSVALSFSTAPAGSLFFGSSNNATFGTSVAGASTTVTVSAPVNFSAGTTSADLTGLVFSNSNGVSFGLSNGTITASAAGGGGGGGIAISASNSAFTSGTVSFNQSGALTIGTGAQAINFSVPATSSMVGAMGVSLSTDGSTISIQRNFNTQYIPHFPFSTASQTLAALGATSASVRFFPVAVSDNLAFNAVGLMHNLSYATSSVPGQQTITYMFGLYSNNGNTLSQISSNSFSLAVTNSSVSNTVSYPVSTGTAGYTYTTLSASTTALAQSYWGTAAGGRPIMLQFGNTMTLSSGNYWLGVLLRHSSSSANIGVSIGVNGNANAVFNNLAGIGQASSAQTTNYSIRRGLSGFGAYTVSRSNLPDTVAISQIAMTQTIMPNFSFLSTV